ncbi:MAG: DNA methyltransferase [Pseudomonadales bacterium]
MELDAGAWREDILHIAFSWNNEAKGKAAVHCVIVGFAAEDISPKWLLSMKTSKAKRILVQVKNINPYLVDAIDTFIDKKSTSFVAPQQ